MSAWQPWFLLFFFGEDVFRHLFILYIDNLHSAPVADGGMSPSSVSERGPDHGRQKEVIMSRNLSKYTLVFLLLALSGLIFLLRNIHSVEVRRECMS